MNPNLVNTLLLNDYISRSIKKTRLLLVCLFCSSSLLRAQEGIPIVEYFGTEDYGAGIQNYAITQDFRGLIYVANNFGLLEFDGTNWQNYETGKGTKVRSVYSDSNGKIFIGAQNEIGYFSPSDNGGYEYHSLNDLIPEEFKNFNEIWDIYPNGEGLVFTGSKELLFFNATTQTIKGISLENSSDFSFNLRGMLFTGFWDGLKYLKEREWVVPPFSDFFKGEQTTGMIPFGNESILISTYEKGVFLVDGAGRISDWAIGYQEIFKKHKVNEMLRLRNGTIAIGTNTDGL